MLKAELIVTPALQAKLRAVQSLAGSTAINPVLLAAAQHVVNDAQGRAPVLSGTLRRSIRAELAEPGVVLVGSDVPYARRIEYGFQGADSRGRHFNQPAQPYLRPAIEENRERVKREIVEGTVALVRRIMAG